MWVGAKGAGEVVSPAPIVSGARLNDPATGYIAKDGSYVVRNDRAGAIVQVSNKNCPEWVAPWD